MKKNLDTGDCMPIILSEVRSQKSEVRTQNSELSLGELSLANYIKYIQTKDRCVGMRCILCAHFRHDGLFAFKRNFSGCSFFACGGFGKIPNADFFIRELSEKFRTLTFLLGSFRKNSKDKLFA